LLDPLLRDLSLDGVSEVWVDATKRSHLTPDHSGGMHAQQFPRDDVLLYRGKFAASSEVIELFLEVLGTCSVGKLKKWVVRL
jgi:hypothetical protein